MQLAWSLGAFLFYKSVPTCTASKESQIMNSRAYYTAVELRGDSLKLLVGFNSINPSVEGVVEIPARRSEFGKTMMRPI